MVSTSAGGGGVPVTVIRPRHGEFQARTGPCGRPKANGKPCGMPRRKAEVGTLERLVNGTHEQWELGGCGRHLTEAEQDFARLVDRVTRMEDAVVRVSGLRLLDEIDLLEREVLTVGPRPPTAGLPACWGWFRDDIEARAIGHTPQPTVTTLRELYAWQDERCAICGLHGAPDVDHDHWSGLVRGFLCRYCNGAGDEGPRSTFWPVAATPFSRYRQLNPARWLDYRLPYTQVGSQERWRAPDGAPIPEGDVTR